MEKRYHLFCKVTHVNKKCPRFLFVTNSWQVLYHGSCSRVKLFFTSSNFTRHFTMGTGVAVGVFLNKEGF